MKLFSINGIDFTSNILVPTYKVNQNDLYETWTDSNYTTHREVTRSKVSGTFTLKFFEIEDYYNFLKVIEDNKLENGAIRNVTCYLNNKNTMFIDKNIFIDFEPADTLPYYGIKDYEGIEITIEER